MTERAPEPIPATTSEPVGPSPELARKNVRLGLALLGLAVLLAAGTVLVALIYLQYD
jgi:hypothetical protein